MGGGGTRGNPSAELRERVRVGRLPAADQKAVGRPMPCGDGTRREPRAIVDEPKTRPQRNGGRGNEVPNRDEGEKGSHRCLLLLKAVARAREAEAA